MIILLQDVLLVFLKNVFREGVCLFPGTVHSCDADQSVSAELKQCNLSQVAGEWLRP